jgi:hypothetical protein
MGIGDGISSHEPDVMPVVLVGIPGVSKSDDKQHGVPPPSS